MDLLVDDLFASRYRLIKQIGIGGFSVVWLAFDEMAGDLEVALKIYAPEKGLEEEGIKLFQKEYRITAKLNHPGLLKATHFDVVNGSPYLVMPYCSRGSLASLLLKEHQLSEKEIVEILLQCSESLSYLHENEVLHQDIKPDNILLDENGRYLMTDFGISSRMRSTLRKSTTSQKALTLAYAPPEKFIGTQTSNEKGDIFSLGVMIFELASGEVPWMGNGGMYLKKDSPLPELPKGYSKDLESIMKSCLNYHSEKRPEASFLVNRCKNYLESGSLTGRITEGLDSGTEGPPTPPSGPFLNKKLLLIISFILISAIGGYYLWVNYSLKSEPTVNLEDLVDPIYMEKGEYDSMLENGENIQVRDSQKVIVYETVDPNEIDLPVGETGKTTTQMINGERKISKIENESGWINYSYNNDSGNLYQVTNNLGTKIDLSFNSLNQLIFIFFREWDSNHSYHLRLSYNDFGKINKIKVKKGPREYSRYDLLLKDFELVGTLIIEYNSRGDLNEIFSSEGQKTSLQITSLQEKINSMVKPSMEDIWSF